MKSVNQQRPTKKKAQPIKPSSGQPMKAGQSPKPGQPRKKKPAKRSHKMRLLFMALSLSGIAMISATAGALLAVSLASTPLMQRQLSPSEASIFSKGDRFSTRMSLQLPALTRPVNILVLGTKVLTTDVNNAPE